MQEPVTTSGNIFYQKEFCLFDGQINICAYEEVLMPQVN